MHPEGAKHLILAATIENAAALGELTDRFVVIGPNGAEIPAKRTKDYDRMATGLLVEAEMNRAGLAAAGDLVKAFRTLAKRRDDMIALKRQMAAEILKWSTAHREAVALAETPAAGSA